MPVWAVALAFFIGLYGGIALMAALAMAREEE